MGEFTTEPWDLIAADTIDCGLSVFGSTRARGTGGLLGALLIAREVVAIGPAMGSDGVAFGMLVAGIFGVAGTIDLDLGLTKAALESVFCVIGTGEDAGVVI